MTRDVVKMFAQLFGYYLLDKNIISTEQLNEALVNKNIYKERLGSLFTTAGYMTPEQVEYLHREQKHFDKKIGDIAVFLGFLTRRQMEELLDKQDDDDTAFGEALINKGYVTRAEYDNLLRAYRQELGLTNDINDKNNLKKDLIAIYGLDESQDVYADYAALFVRNSIRFVGDDFAFAGFHPEKEGEQECMICQEISGSDNFMTSVCGSQKAFNAFAARCTGKTTYECSHSDVRDFLILQNSLYAANRFASDGTKLTLGQAGYSENEWISDRDGKLIIPLSFTFGKIYVSIIKK
jgi:hypothetical protein